MSLADCFGIGLFLTLIGALSVTFEYSPLARTRFARDWIYSDAPSHTATGRRRLSRILSWCILFAGHVMLVVGASWWLWETFPE